LLGKIFPSLKERKKFTRQCTLALFRIGGNYLNVGSEVLFCSGFKRKTHVISSKLLTSASLTIIFIIFLRKWLRITFRQVFPQFHFIDFDALFNSLIYFWFLISFVWQLLNVLFMGVLFTASLLASKKVTELGLFGFDFF
jgi:hypothetical protein